MYSLATYRTSTDSKAEALRSEDFFTKNREDYIWGWRHAIQRDERRLYCGFCGQLLKISGGGESKQRVHFRHKFKHAAENCIFQDDESLSKQVIEWQKYANEEESVLHKQSKLLIADTLEKYGADTRIEQYIKDEQNHGHYRRPDVHAIFPDKDVVVEVQLTSTFLDVILDRRDFYQSHKMFLMWVVNEFRPDLFPQKDIFYSSRENIFVFDAEARMCTAKEGKLYLKCYHRSYYCDESGEIRELDFQCDWITFEDLTFDTNDYTVYYFDESVNKEQCKAERARILKERDEKEELERKRLDAIRIQREIEEQKRNRLLQIQKELAQKEEEKRKRKQEAEQKTVVKLSGLLFTTAFVVAGLNWRYGWWLLPNWAVWVAAWLFLGSYLLYAEVLRENTYLSRTIEVQENQKVIDTGLYSIVRHPMYMATTILFLAMPLVLASPISFMIMLLYIPVIAKRIKNEEKVLEEGLEGYAEYKEKVKYKVLPFIW